MSPLACQGWSVVAFDRAKSLGSCLVGLLLVGCAAASPDTGPDPPPLWLTAAAVGIDYLHESGRSGDRTLVEILGPGGALLDADGDGDLDLLIRQAAPLDRPDAGRGDRFYRNLLIESGGSPQSLAFVDATEGSGLDQAAYGIGVTTGDVDGDGLVDLYLTNFGPDRLLRNRGGLRFQDLTEPAGSNARDGITGAAVFVDLDRDGDLDLVTGGYTDFGLASHRTCRSAAGGLDYCGPLTYGPGPVVALRNDGRGAFEDVTRQLGLATARANALGMATADVDDNGFSDVFLASDGLENQLWMNDGSTLENQAIARGVAVNAAGLRTGDMGVDFGDANGDGRLDLVATHLAGEIASLWVDVGGGYFEDRALRLGLGRSTGAGTGFGVSWLDFDLDGRLDLLIANGSVRVLEELERLGEPVPLHQRQVLLHNLGDDGFVDASLRADELFGQPMVGRGLIVGDLDNDGGLDAILATNEGPVHVFRSPTPPSAQWVGFDLRLVTGAPALGATIRATAVDGSPSLRHVHVDGSYASARDPRVVVGLAGRAGPVTADIRWPSGSVQRIDGLEPGRYHRLMENQTRAHP